MSTKFIKKPSHSMPNIKGCVRKNAVSCDGDYIDIILAHDGYFE